MQKKMLTVIISIVCVFALAIVIVGYMFKEGIINDNNLFAKKDVSTTSTKSETEDINTLPSNAFLMEGAECYLDCGMNINEKCPIYFKFNSLSVSKEMGDFDLCDDWSEIKDKNGTIINEYSYVTCNITILNKGEVDFETTLNNLWLFFGTNGGYTEARTYNSKKEDTFAKDYYYCTLKPDTEYNFNIAYVVEDDVIAEFKSDMLVFISFIEPTWDTSYPVIEKQ
ncbi:MAG: hypothetical protein IJE16_00405 [Ruminococcus sp.]|nr:hypothetical protein [Ruminococcus sp.]